MGKFKELTEEQQIIVDVLNKSFLKGQGNPLTILRRLEAKLKFKLKN